MRLLKAIVVTLPVLLLLGFWFLRQPPASGAMQIRMGSDPFPLVVGQTSLRVWVSDSSGAPVDSAAVSVYAAPKTPGMLPISSSATRGDNGEYRVPMIWPMMGAWHVEVTAALPDENVLQEQFDVFIYSIPPPFSSTRTTFRGAGEGLAYSQDPAREFRIVIPQGTQALIAAGHGDDVMPADIRLQVDGVNTLIIQNDDIADHTIGPFFVRSGEIIRQEFHTAGVYEGRCSVRHDAVVNITIEE